MVAAVVLGVVAVPSAAMADDVADPPSGADVAAEPDPAPSPVRATTEAAPLAAPSPTDPCFPNACIDNGTVRLGVNDDGSLVTFDRDAEELVGLQQTSTGNDALREGDPFEGWGVADLAAGVGGSAVSGSEQNVTVESFDVSPSTATSVVLVGDPGAPTFRVTHAFAPSLLDPNVYVIRVRIENLTTGTLQDVRYRRVMDWDVEPTAFSEIVDVVDRDLEVVETRDSGFNAADPRTPNALGTTGDRDGSAPGDLGATFDLDLGSIASGDFVEFFLFYGVAPTEAGALESLDGVSADSYSTARPSSGSDGSPGTFFFGFEPIPRDPEVPPLDPDPPSDDDAPDGSSTAAAPVPMAAVLPATGAEPMAPFVVGGVALLAGGIAMVGLGRRRVEQA